VGIPVTSTGIVSLNQWPCICSQHTPCNSRQYHSCSCWESTFMYCNTFYEWEWFISI